MMSDFFWYFGLKGALIFTGSNLILQDWRQHSPGSLSLCLWWPGNAAGSETPWLCLKQHKKMNLELILWQNNPDSRSTDSPFLIFLIKIIIRLKAPDEASLWTLSWDRLVKHRKSLRRQLVILFPLLPPPPLHDFMSWNCFLMNVSYLLLMIVYFKKDSITFYSLDNRKKSISILIHVKMM